MYLKALNLKIFQRSMHPDQATSNMGTSQVSAYQLACTPPHLFGASYLYSMDVFTHVLNDYTGSLSSGWWLESTCNFAERMYCTARGTGSLSSGLWLENTCNSIPKVVNEQFLIHQMLKAQRSKLHSAVIGFRLRRCIRSLLTYWEQIRYRDAKVGKHR